MKILIVQRLDINKRSLIMEQLIKDNVKNIDVVSCIDSKLLITNTDLNSLETKRAKIKFIKGITYFDSILPLPTDLIHIICEYCLDKTNFNVNAGQGSYWKDVIHDLVTFRCCKTDNIFRLYFTQYEHRTKPHYFIITKNGVNYFGPQWVLYDFLYLYHDLIMSKKIVNDKKLDNNSVLLEYLYHEEWSIEATDLSRMSASIYPNNIVDYYVFGEYQKGVLDQWILISKDNEVRNILLDLYYVVDQLGYDIK